MVSSSALNSALICFHLCNPWLKLVTVVSKLFLPLGVHTGQHYLHYMNTSVQNRSVSICVHPWLMPFRFQVSSFSLALCSLLLAALPASALTANPYVSAITNRNVFSLKSAADLEAAKPPPPPNIPAVKLAGITTIMGGKRAILRVPRAARPPIPATEISLMLKEGAPAEEGVKVLEINIAEATVRIDNNGTVQTLDLEKDAPKGAPAAPVAPAIPVPAVQPGSIPVPRPAGGGLTGITRPVRGGGPAMTGDNPGLGAGGMMGAGPTGIAKPEAQPVPSAEEQIIMMEVWRERDKDKIAAGDLPPYPPTELTPLVNGEESGQDGPPALPF